MLAAFWFAQLHFQLIAAQSASSNSCNDINNCRLLSDVFWGCVTTIFTCIWVSVHPNVPPPKQSWLALLFRRLRLMIFAVVAPEIMVGFAARQFLAARRTSKVFDLSRTHGFCFSMGGFISQTGQPIATKGQLDREYVTAIRSISAADIMDKSKGDALMKSAALAQNLWFATRCLARVFQHMALTQLELATLAFIVVNLFITLLWWEKPLDVQEPIRIVPRGISHNGDNTGTGVSSQRCCCDSLLGTLLGTVSGFYPHYDAKSFASVPSFWSGEVDKNGEFDMILSLLLELLVGVLFGAIHCTSWNKSFLFPTSTEMWLCRCCSLPITTIPVALALIVVAGRLFECFLGQHIPDACGLIAGSSFTSLLPIYMIARLFLIALPFAGLRSLPPGALIDWNVNFPQFLTWA